LSCVLADLAFWCAVSLVLFFVQRSLVHRDLHSFPTRRSSDLERVKDCAEVLEYKVSYETGEKTLYRVWFCKSRLCPMCNWRRAMKHGIQSQKVVAEVIKQKPTVRWLFLTLTVRNVYDG